MEDGIYYNLSFEDYLKKPGLSNSILSELNKSPAHFKYFMEHPRKPSEAQEFGTLVHTAILEPQELENRYVKSPFTGENKLDLRKTAHKKTKADFIAKIGDKKIIEPADYEALMIIRDNVEKHSMLLALLDQGKNEVSFQWDHNGIYMKGRTDKICGHLPAIADIKTTANAQFAPFQSSIFKFGYHRQAANYIDGLSHFQYDIKDYFIIAVENEPPYNIQVFQMPQEIIDLGRKELDALIDKYKKCCLDNEWPGYSNEVQICGVPNWYLTKMGDELYE